MARLAFSLLGLAIAVSCNSLSFGDRVEKLRGAVYDKTSTRYNAIPAGWDTPLDKFVNAPDPAYSWHDTGHRINLGLATGYVLNMTSQTWVTPDNNTRPVWWHTMVVVVPLEWDRSRDGFVYVTGGSNHNGEVPTAEDEDVLVVASVAIESGTIGACLKQVPNQPVVFDLDPSQEQRHEDGLIAWTWLRWIQTQSHPERLVRFPMVKAAMKSLDTLEAFAKSTFGVTVDRFAVAGASKRGWVTWLVGAVAPPGRVIAIMPLVLDILNLTAVMHHQFKAYNGWTWAFKDYYRLNLTQYLDSDSWTTMRQQIDPIFYRDRLTMPKLVVVSSDDEFMMIDDPNFWWNSMPGEKHLQIATNAEHSLVTGIAEVLETTTAFYDSVRKGGRRPQMSWTIDPDHATIELTVTSRPVVGGVTIRHANTLSSTMRDFRWIVQPPTCNFPNIKVKGLCVQPIVFFSETPDPVNKTATSYVYRAQMTKPDFGWKGFYFDVEFPSDTGLRVNYRLTSQAVITPNTFPFPDCHGASCLGTLV
eukprot:TRINITY_DN21004_c0_g1_i1.p1 TRINITY_DN21004_c0_g1~~TRINITY_DN21004_c0_g1_i1.p1  ORF type:complete len:562 (-),score=146.05 TRINITY_DN21004_c0_g1_i1:753-2339(-)